jgi:hypothetical protein
VVVHPEPTETSRRSGPVAIGLATFGCPPGNACSQSSVPVAGSCAVMLEALNATSWRLPASVSTAGVE